MRHAAACVDLQYKLLTEVRSKLSMIKKDRQILESVMATEEEGLGIHLCLSESYSASPT